MVVTGGSRGIGARTALLAAEAGYNVAVCYAREAQAAERVVADVQIRGQQALAVCADVSQERDVLRLFAAVDDQLGRVDVLVNSAGIVDAPQRVEAMSAQRIARMLAVNVLGSMLCAREAVKRMSTRNGGRGGAIINISSIAARGGSPGEYVDYAASKGAIDTFTLGLAKEVATEGIRVNAVRPGIIDTEIHASGGQPDRAQRMASAIPFGRAGQPDEVARAILWLASNEASYCTGALLDVSGGR
jgi:NAD(P)-dependent dehydrogenase (short-subunit alcohol dehydrogenase family)